ncbi:MAG: hypothetical protein GKR89_18035 [Candidatus Latescibacteria bacterium]|nr:hypothetical protein [Candidatus Latescibacterota bacterium]
MNHLSLTQLIAPDAELRCLANTFKFTEGPAADDEGNIYFVDIGARRIHFWDVKREALSTIRENSGGADGMFVDAEGSLWICEMHDKRISKIAKDGTYTVVLDSFEGQPFTGPNDLWFDDIGGLYFTDSYGGHEERGNTTRVFYYTITGELALLADDYYKSNGLHGSPDGGWLYIADYLDDKIYRYTMFLPGQLRDQTLFAPYRCDGMAVDEHGNIYLCTGNSGQGVVVLNSDGNMLGTINTPENPHNICFGGPTFSTLYITATHGFYALEMAVCGAANGSPHRYSRDFGGLADLIQPDVKPQQLTTGFHIAQGPAALPNGDFYFSDLHHNRVLKWEFAQQTHQVIQENVEGSDGLAVTADGTLLICELLGKRLSKITPEGVYEVIADSFAGVGLTGANDIYLDREGGLYFSDSYPGFDATATPTYCVYYIAPDSNELKPIITDLYKGKGIHISADEKWIYMADFGGRKVYRYELLAPGVLGRKELFIDRMCGGLTLDEHGNVYISTVMDAAGIMIYSPQGKLIGQILIPENTTNVTFAGPAGETLVITTFKSVYTVDLQVRGLNT